MDEGKGKKKGKKKGKGKQQDEEEGETELPYTLCGALVHRGRLATSLHRDATFSRQPPAASQ